MKPVGLRSRIVTSIGAGGALFALLVTTSGQVPAPTWLSVATTMNGHHTQGAAVMLAQGKVLITGGIPDPLPGGGAPTATDLTTIFERDGTLRAGSRMRVARTRHTATLLASGQVFVAGGSDGVTEALASSEIYDPSTNSWTLVDPPSPQAGVARAGHVAVRLDDGRVLLAGGDTMVEARSDVHLFDPGADTFTLAGHLSSPRTNLAIASLADGRILLIGGNAMHLGDGLVPSSAVDIYNPVTHHITATAPMTTPRTRHTATTLLDGRVLVTGGSDGTTELASAEIFDPVSGIWTPAPFSMTGARQNHRAVLLPDYGVLIVGGSAGGVSLASTELFNKSSGMFVSAGLMTAPRSEAVAVALEAVNDVFVGGGFSRTAETFHTTAAPNGNPLDPPVPLGACTVQAVAPATISVRVGNAVATGFSIAPGSGSGAMIFSLASGSLPAGVTFDNGMVSGAAQETGFFPITATVTETATGCTSTSNVLTLAVYGRAVRTNAGFRTSALTTVSGDETVVAGRCDDCSSQVVFPSTFRPKLFGVVRSRLFVNNNGNVSFNFPYSGTGLDEFPLPARGATAALQMPILAPFLADVDTRNVDMAGVPAGTSDWTTFGYDTIDGRTAFGVNWLYVGRYAGDESVRNTFQLVIIDRSDLGAGRVEVEYNYDRIDWAHGATTDWPRAQVGWDAGDGLSRYEVPDTASDATGLDLAVLNDAGVERLPERAVNSTEPGRVRFAFASCSLYVNPPAIQTGTLNVALTRSFTSSLGQAPVAFSVPSNTLPAGVTLSANGTLAGTPTAGGTFPLTVTATDASGCSATAAYTLVISTPAATVALANLSQVYTGTAKVALATTVPAGLPVTLTYNGSATAPSAAGSYAVSATINSPAHTGSATGTLVIDKAHAILSFNALVQPFDGTPKTAVVTTTPPGLPVTLTYNGSVSPPSLAGSYAIAATVHDPNYVTVNTATLLISAPCGLIVDNPAPLVTRVQTPISETFGHHGVAGAAVFALASGSLPPGMTLSPAGVLAGTPTVTGDFSITVRATQAGGCTALGAPFSIKVNGGALRRLPGFTTTTIAAPDADAQGRCDDCSALVDLAAHGWAPLKMFGGEPFSALFVNNNGAVSINGPLPAHSSTTLPLDDPSVGPVLAPFLADVDTSDAGFAGLASGTADWVTYGFDTIDGHRAFGVNWFNVGSSPAFEGTRNTFQLVIIEREDLAIGSFDVEYNYDAIAWLRAAGSDGPTIGWDGGPTGRYFDWSSGKTDADILALPATSISSSEPGRFRFASYECSSMVAGTNRQSIVRGTPYIRSIVPTTNTGPYSFSVQSGSLPPGLALADGTLAGTPTQVGRSLFQLLTIDAGGCAVSSPFDLTVVEPTPAVSLSGLTQVYNGAPRAITATTNPPGLSVNVTYNGSSTPPIQAGSYAVAASLSSDPSTPPVTGTLTIARAVAGILTSNLLHAYDGTDKAPKVTTTPSGLSVTVTYDGGSIPRLPGSYGLLVTAQSANYYGTAHAVLIVDGGGHNYSCSGFVVTLPPIARAHAPVADADDVLHGYPFSTAFTTTGGPATFTLGSGTLPAGLTLAANGTLSGTPMVAGSFPITVVATLPNSCAMESLTYPLVVSSPLRLLAGFTANTMTGGADYAGPPDAVGRSDDSSKPVDLKWPIVLAGVSYDQLFVNNNGNVSFGSAVSSYVPQAFPLSPPFGLRPILGPFFADVDTRNPSQFPNAPRPPQADWVTYGFDIVNGHRAFGVNWFNVGRYNRREDLRNTFQLVVIEREDLGSGSYDVEYNYEKITWLQGDASATNASVGYQLSGPQLYYNFAGSQTASLLNLPTLNTSEVGNAPGSLYSDPEVGRLPLHLRASACSAPQFSASIDGSYGVAMSYTPPAPPGSARFAIESGTLPDGISLASDGTLSGTPVEAGDFLVVLSISDGTCRTPSAAEYTVHIAKRDAVVTLSNLEYAFDGSPKAATVTTTPAGLNVLITYNGYTVSPVQGGSYEVIATIADDEYGGTASGTLVIHRAATVALSNLTATYTGAPVPVLATTNPAGLAVSIAYDGFDSPPINAGHYTVVATINDPVYIGSATATLVIHKANAQVTVGNLTQTYDGTPKAPSVTTVPSGLRYTVNYGGAAPRLPGEYPLTIAIDEPNYMSPVASGQYSLTILRAPATVTLADLQHVYDGTPRPVTTAASPAGVQVLVLYDGATEPPTNAGSYTVEASATGRYIGTATGTLVIARVPASVTPAAASKIYGAADPVLSGALAGFLPGDNVTATYSRAEGETVGGGPYSISAVLSPAAVLGNYAITSHTASFTIAKAGLTVTADNQSKVYGGGLPALTATYAGFVNGDGAASLVTPVTLTTGATAASAVGSYPITASGAASPNYDISYVTGTLDVTKAALTVAADDQTKVYGGALPPLTASYRGLVNGDTVASLDTPAALQTPATAASGVGDYPITASGVSSPNYEVSYVAATLSVTKAPLIVTVNDADGRPDEAFPAFTASYAGFVNGDTPAALGGTLAFSTPAMQPGPAGDYPITASGLASSNYAITFVSGTLTVANLAPVAASDAYTTQWNTVLTIPANGVLANDADANQDALRAIQVSGPLHGALTLNADGSFAYKPAANYSGDDAFTYKANDGLLDSAVVTVTLTITSPCGNDRGHHRYGRDDDDREDRDDHDKMEWDHCKPPTPNSHSDKYQTLKNKVLTVTPAGVLKNDGRPAAVAELYTAPLRGTVTLAANGGFVYTPAAGFTGTDVFYYVARSATGVAGAVTSVRVKVSGHHAGDGDDHDKRRNGHRDGDSCEHDEGHRGSEWRGKDGT